MKAHGIVAVVALLALVSCGPGSETPPADTAVGPASPLEGAWRATEIRGPDGATLSDPPSLYLFTGNHYSIMRVAGQQPRPTFAAPSPTDSEKITAFDTFIANAGSYELAGDTLIIQPIVSKHPNYMGGGQDKMQFRLAGDTLWLTGNSGNIRYLINGQLVPPTEPVTETTFRLIRLE
jgi:hypothetical protein